MKVYYLQSNKRIIQVLYDDEVFKTDLSNLSPYYVIDIPEIEQQKNLCFDLVRTLNKVDKDGNPKHYVDKGQIKERLGWEEQVEAVK